MQLTKNPGFSGWQHCRRDDGPPARAGNNNGAFSVSRVRQELEIKAFRGNSAPEKRSLG